MANINLTPGERYTFGRLNNVSVITDSTDNAQSPKYIRNILYVTSSTSPALYVKGGSSSGNSTLYIESEGSSDPILRLSVGSTAAENWVVGIDNSDNDTFKIHNGTSIGSAATLALAIDINENISIPGNVSISGSFALGGIANTVTTNALYYNPTTKQVTYGASGSGGGGGTPGGSDTQIQYNNAGAFGGVSVLTWDGTTLRATGSFTGSLTGIATSGSSILVSNTPSTAGTYYPVFVNGITGYRTALVDNSTFTYDTTTNTLTVTSSYATNALTASIATTALTASYTLTASYFSGSIANSINTDNIKITDNPTYGGVTYYPTFVGNTSGYTSALVDSSLFTYNPSTNILSTTSSYAITASYAETASFSLATTENRVLALNQSGNTISKGVVVRITGSNTSSDIPRIVTASYENDNNSANTLGITFESIANGATGFVTTEGILTGVNTNAFVSGQLIYLGATGSIIGTAPQSPLHSVRLGEVVRHQTNNGSIYVRIDNGYEIEELHDVLITSASSGDLLVRSGSVWTNSKQLSGSYAITGSLTSTSITTSNATISGNVTVLGTASINTLIVNQIGYSSGSNQLGDAANDTQTLFGSVIIPTGSLTVTGSQAIYNPVSSISGLNIMSPQTSAGSLVLSTIGTPGTNNGAYLILRHADGTFPTPSTTDSSRLISTQNSQYFSGSSYFTATSIIDIASGKKIFGVTPTFGGTLTYYGKLDNGNWYFGDLSSNTNTARDTSANARVHIKGSGTTSATTALRVENSNASASLTITDNGVSTFFTTTASLAPVIIRNGTTTDNARLLQFVNSDGNLNLEIRRTVTAGRGIELYQGTTKFLSTDGNDIALSNANLFLQNAYGSNVGLVFGSSAAGLVHRFTNDGQQTFRFLADLVNGGATWSTTVFTANTDKNTPTNRLFDFRIPVQISSSISQSATIFQIIGNNNNTILTVNTSSLVTITGSLTVTGGITGSLLGTSSYATQALSASWAPSSPVFPFTGSAIISGSLTVTGSLIVSGSSTLVNVGPAIFSGSITQTASTASFGGLVGIGTTTPSTLLHIQRATNGEVLRFRDTTNANQDYVFETESTGTFYGLNIKNNSNGLSLLNISADQKIGIATNDPLATLHVNKSAADTYQILIGNNNGLGIGSDGGGQQRHIIGSAYGNAATKISFTLGGFTTASDKMTIYGTGNVGIGTSTDAGYKLDVNGIARISTSTSGTGITLTSTVSGNAGNFLISPNSSAIGSPGDFTISTPNGSRLFIAGNYQTLINSSAGVSISQGLGIGGNLTISGAAGSNILYGSTTYIGGTSNTSSNIFWTTSGTTESKILWRLENLGSYGLSNLFLCINNSVSTSNASISDAKMSFFNNGNVAIGTTTDSGFKLNVSGSGRFTNGLTVTGSLSVSGGITGSITSASFASTASFVNTLNQNVIITGSAVIASTSLGPSENTLTLGARDTVNEGGQLGFNAPGGTYTSASMLDNYQNRFRLLRGTNAGSDAEVVWWNMHTKQMSLPAYTNASSFTGTATANLAVDSGGNVITVSTTGGTVFPYTGNAVITGSLTTTGIIYAQPNGGMYFQGGDDAALYDINVANTMGVYGVQTVTEGAIKLGSNGPVLHGSGSRLGLGTTTPTSASFTVDGNVWATSFTGSLSGTAATASFYAGTVTSASFATTAKTAETASKIISNGSVTGGNHHFYISTFEPVGGSVGVIQTSNLVYNSSTNTLPTTASWASRAITASFYGGSVTSASFASTASYVNTLTQDVVITGSLDVNGNTNVTGNAGFGTNAPTVRVEIDAADNGGQRALKIRNTDSGSLAFAAVDFKTTNNDPLSIIQFNDTVTSYAPGDVVFLNQAVGANMWFGNSGNTDKLVISNGNNVGIGYSVGNTPNVRLGVSGSVSIVQDLTIEGNAGNTLNLNYSTQINGYDSTNNKVLSYDGNASPTMQLGYIDGANLDMTVNQGFIEVLDNQIIAASAAQWAGEPTAQGTIITLAEAGEQIFPQQLLFLSSSGQWYKADADLAAKSTPLLGICLTEAEANDSISVLLEGHYSTQTYHDQVATPAIIGAPLYVSTNAGYVTEVAPIGSGDIVRLIGHNLYGELGSRGPDWVTVRFKPDNTWIEI